MTTHTKTAISLQSNLYGRAEAYAQTHQLSRSELYARALAEYLERHEAASLLAQMNAVYADEEYSEEEERQYENLQELGFEALERAYREGDFEKR